MSLQLSGFTRERPRLIVEICLFARLLELRDAGRIEEVRPGRWRVKPRSLEAVKQLSETWGERALKVSR